MDNPNSSAGIERELINIALALKNFSTQAMYPIGSIYLNAATNANPADLFGFGTWAAWGSGRVPVGVNTGDADFAAVEQTGGQKNVQAHSHSMGSGVNQWVSGGAPGSDTAANITQGGGAFRVRLTGTDSTGTGSTNMNPYVTVYMWKRTA